jgi:hypothetical protein
MHALRNIGDGEQIRLARCIERVAGYNGAKLLQPQTEPTAFEAGMASHEYTLA